MRYTTLGHSDIEVSGLCLGGMSFGEASPDFHQWTIGPDGTRAVIARALDQGINFIDTANCYSFGTSEEYIGRALRDLGVARDKVVLASKVHFNEGGLSAAAIAREIDDTLQRLGTDYLDLYIIHRFDYDVPMEETMGALDALIDELAGLPCGRARIRRLKEYRRDLLGGINAEQRKLDCLDYLTWPGRSTPKKMLVVCYSWANGNTEKIAEQLADACDADIERIETVEPYPEDYDETVEQGRREVDEGFEPEIEPLEHDVDDYDVIAIGTPTWWYTMAPAVRSFLSENDLSGKTVVPFMTNGGWPGSVIDDIEAACDGASFGPSMEVQFDSTGGSKQVTPQRDIDAWIACVSK